MESADSVKNNNKSKQKGSEFAGWAMLSRVRPELFGCAMIGIVIFHLCEDILFAYKTGGNGYKTAWVYDKLIGSSGVEIFVILSGIGLCFSMHKDSSIAGFYKKRVIRILPEYLICGVLLWGVKDIILNKGSLGDFCKDFFFVTFFTDGVRTLWYILFISGAYLIYPLLFNIFSYPEGKEKSRRERRNKAIIAAVMIAVTYLMILWVKKKAPNFYKRTEIALLRVPVFFYGAYLGEKVYRKKMISGLDLLLPVIGVILKTMYAMDRTNTKIRWNWRFNGRFAVFLFSIAMLLFLAIVFDMLKSADKLRILRKLLRVTGKYSLEIYLGHIVVRALMIKKWGTKEYLSKYWLYLICTVVMVAALAVISKMTRKWFSRKKTEH